MLVPKSIDTVGLHPSNPPWKPTENCLLFISDESEPVSSYPYALVPPTTFTVPSNANTVFPPCVADAGKGAK